MGLVLLCNLCHYSRIFWSFSISIDELLRRLLNMRSLVLTGCIKSFDILLNFWSTAFIFKNFFSIKYTSSDMLETWLNPFLLGKFTFTNLVQSQIRTATCKLTQARCVRQLHLHLLIDYLFYHLSFEILWVVSQAALIW